MKILFACDLDNTLLVPKRERQDGDICAEKLNGTEQSFLTHDTPDLLQRLVRSGEVAFLPVTTRSEAQYKRIELPVSPRYALICNGLALLENGVLSPEWDEWAAPVIKKHLPEAERLLAKYSELGDFTSLRLVDGKFLFAAFAETDTAEKRFAEFAKETTLDIALSGRKIYWLPTGADKGTAVRRFAELHGCERIVATGDSSIDLPMLDAADVAIVPDEKLAGMCKCSDVRVCKDTRFPDFILQTIGAVAD